MSAAILRAIAALFVRLADEAEPAPPPVPPPPAPIPSPPPAPEPPPQIAPTVTHEPMTPGRMVVFVSYYSGGRYDRFQGLWSTLPGAAVRIAFRPDSFLFDGGNLPPGEAVLLLNGAPIARTVIPAGAKTGEFASDFSAVAEGWHAMRIEASGWPCPTMWIYVIHGATAAAHETMGVATASYGLMHPPKGQTYVHRHARVPARFAPVTQPLQSITATPFATKPARAMLKQVQLAICRPDDNYRPARDKRGIWTTSNRQPYFWEDYTDKTPRLPLLDGPRGHGCVQGATHLQVGRNGKVYFTDFWRFGVMEVDGAVRTLAGIRHKGMARFWGDVKSGDASRPVTVLEEEGIEFVGDWSAVPRARWGFHETWGMAWLPSSLLTDPNAPPIGGEQPHAPGGPVAFISDSLSNRICRLEFSPTDRAAPAKITEFLALNNPWDVVCDESDVLYVSERGRNRVSRFSAAGVHLGDMPLPGLLRPEGLFLLDGVLYVGSLTEKAVRRFDLRAGVELPRFPLQRFDVTGKLVWSLVDNNSRFVKIAVSDGTWGPRGSVMVSTWSNNRFGYPPMLGPDGSEIDYMSGTTLKGLPWSSMGYPTAAGIGNGQMVCSSSNEGVVMLLKAETSDPATPTSEAWAAMVTAWVTRGFDLLYGHQGFGFYGLPLPWGASPETDRYLETWGHVRPG